MNSEQFNELIKRRRSIFPTLFTGEVVEDDIVQQMLENAHWAPMHKLTYPWRFKVYTGEGIKKLANFMAECYKEVSTNKGNFDEKNYQKLLTKPLLSSHIISIGMKSSGMVPEIEEIEAVSCAVENMYLTAAAYDVGMYWGTGGVTYIEEAKSFFDLDEQDKLLGFVFIGKPKIWPEGKRKDINDFVEWVK
ncbi:nitroreductase family protein [Aureibacter tunicatorum]|uniref:Nitroreductase n=1 Tax=Aureibacter tunicatorum TaxID=866807 RepID=A0AAE3XK61_9BACT|nr:nitroreductase [Aureibacter tunicatorum]MDR6237494.1 nitroreductase [Aureibacter tunicatorum]BDD02528.1 hypothetical protein AUTU_00110 [Aureibacter tunicatorum]